MFIYDIEIQNGIAPKNPAERKQGINYCDGWTDWDGMKIACIGCYDYTTDKYLVFGENDLEDFKLFIQLHDVAVGFNNIRFDNNLLRANDVVIQPSKSYDILAEIYAALGSYQKGCRLEDCVKANFSNVGKTGNGADAPIDWQRGLHTKVINYCLNDVRITKMLLDKILRFGYINNPIYPSEILRMKRP